MKRALTLLLTVTFATTLIACNTVEGVGKDLEKGGEQVQDVAQDAKDGK
ncbi:entericidin A/B family lipoprotein [Chitinibacteraceae bacterium HSL-7]